MNGALLNVFGLGKLATEPKVKDVGGTKYIQVQLAQYPVEEVKRVRGFIWMELKARENQPIPKKGDVVSIASATYDVHKVERDGGTKHYHTLTAYVWRILPSGPPAKNTEAPESVGATAPGSKATPPELADEDIPF